jgi:regulator of protease activity HflC (stomatin/prohibitin superfamily)
MRNDDSERFSLFRYGKWVLLGMVVAGVILVLMFITSFYFTVDQNEVAGVTRNGALISDKPIGPGMHFKMPIFDSVHKIRTSIDKLAIDGTKVKTPTISLRW